jgi:hypothetical protein
MKYKAKILEGKDAEENAEKPLKDWYRPPLLNSPDASSFKKTAAVVFILVAVTAMVLLAFSKITWIEFWITTIFCAVFAWFVLPKMK